MIAKGCIEGSMFGALGAPAAAPFFQHYDGGFCSIVEKPGVNSPLFCSGVIPDDSRRVRPAHDKKTTRCARLHAMEFQQSIPLHHGHVGGAVGGFIDAVKLIAFRFEDTLEVPASIIETIDFSTNLDLQVGDS